MTRGSPGWLGDTQWRDYGRKLDLWNAFAGPELRALLTTLVPPTSRLVLDAGCGTGHVSRLIQDILPQTSRVFALDLAWPHLVSARRRLCRTLQADLRALPLSPESFDLIWSANTLHHLPDPVESLKEIRSALRPGGLVAIGHGSYLPDMLFAWDSRLERLTNEAVRAYYRDRYGRSETELAGIRAWTGRLRQAGFSAVTARTIAIERISPLDEDASAYIQECLFDGTFRGRLSPYLSPEDGAELEALMDSQSPAWALTRPDFHFLQTFTVTTGRKPGPA